MKKVLDAYALLAFLEREASFEKIESYFVAAVERDNPLLMTSVNWGEVYYIVLRECGQEKANEIERIIQTLPIEIKSVDQQLAKEAGRFKARHKMSYADCFTAALTKINKAELITGDKEFRDVESELKILWMD